jgi:hypothetical protein
MQNDGLLKLYLKYLSGPIIQPFKGRWDMPESLLDLISMARLLQILKGEANDDEQGLASEEEALGYLYSLTLEAPLSSAWARIYIWLGQQVFPRWKFPAAGLAPVTLSHDEVRLLRDLRRWLRRTTETNARNRARKVV